MDKVALRLYTTVHLFIISFIYNNLNCEPNVHYNESIVLLEDFTMTQHHTVTLLNLHPVIHSAHRYEYVGGPYEKERIGSSYALHLFTEGKGSMTVNERRLALRRGDLVIIPPAIPHTFHAAADNRMHCYNVYFTVQGGREVHDKKTDLSFIFSDAPSPNRPEIYRDTPRCSELEELPAFISMSTWPYLIDSFMQIIACDQTTGPSSRKAAELLLHSWLLQLSDALIIQPESIDPHISSLLVAIEQDADWWNYSINTMLNRSGLGRTRFFSLFRLSTGESPTAYLLRLRMRKAALMIRESGLSVTEIAEKLGYPTIHYFSNQFKQYYGISPTQFKLSRW
jgi:AraC-like DNA-binding protein